MMKIFDSLCNCKMPTWADAVPTTILVCLLTIFHTCFTVWRKRSKMILFTGFSGSGRTELFLQLKDGTSQQGTVTSMEPNEDTFKLRPTSAPKEGKSKPVRIFGIPAYILDIPGNIFNTRGHILLQTYLIEVLPKSSCLIFVVDASEFMFDAQAVAEYLYDILTNEVVIRRKIPVLLTCNKMDKITALSSNSIKRHLEEELNKLRKLRSTQSDSVYLGVEGEDPFTFTQCSNEIRIAEVSALTGQVEQVKQFIWDHVYTDMLLELRKINMSTWISDAHIHKLLPNLGKGYFLRLNCCIVLFWKVWINNTFDSTRKG